MPAAPALRKSKRLALHAQAPAATPKAPDHPVHLSTPATAKVTRNIRKAPARRIPKKTLEDLDISDSDDPPTVEVPVFFDSNTTLLT